MGALVRKIVIEDGLIEAHYTWTGADGLPQSAAINIAADVTALQAQAQADVDSAIAAVVPSSSTPASVVAAMTLLGQARVQLAAKQQEAADLDAKIALKQQALVEATAALAAVPTEASPPMVAKPAS